MDIFRFVGPVLLQTVLLLGSSVADDNVIPNSATKVKFDFALLCKVGDHTFILEKTTLADVIQTLGGGVIRDVGTDAANINHFVDYRDRDHLIRFSSNAEMGGYSNELEGVEIRPLTASEKVADLPSLRLPITFQFGSLGMSFSNLTAILGSAVKTLGIAWYEYSGKRPIKVSSGETLDYDVLATLKVKIVAGKVAAIDLGHVSSY